MARHNPPVNGEVLYQARQELGLTQVEVMKLTADAGFEVDDSNLSKLERGLVRHPKRLTWKTLGKVYKLTHAQMFAPCGTCGTEWSAACIEHPEAVPEQNGAAA